MGAQIIQLFMTSDDLFFAIYLYSNVQRLIHQHPCFIVSFDIIKKSFTKVR